MQLNKKFYYLKVVNSIPESFSDEIWDPNIKDSKRDSIVFRLIGEKLWGKNLI